MRDMSLAEFLMEDVGKVEKLPECYCETIREFWDAVVAPLLPKKETMENLMRMLVRYCEEPDAVYVIRNYADRKKSAVEQDKRSIDKECNSALRRGFWSRTNRGYSIFYTDNYFTLFFEKMALNDYVPDYDVFKSMMLARTFPAKCGPYDSHYESKKAAYDIAAKKGKDPGYGTAGYKLSHIFDAGKGYWIEEEKECVTVTKMCDAFFPRGCYEDWKWEDETEVYVRDLSISEDKAELAKKWLKAHFLRVACPLNYVLTPKAICQKTSVEIENRDIAEDTRFQQYAMYRFKQLYGDVFEEYCNYLMIEPGIEGVDCGDEVIKLEFSLKIGQENREKGILTKENAKRVLEKVLSLYLSHRIEYLINEDYCMDEIGLKKSVYEEKNGMFEVRKTWLESDVKLMNKWLKEELSYIEEVIDDI